MVCVATELRISAAGSDTSAAAMSWWSLAMLAHPEVQKRAQDELDAVVGQGRVPTFADKSHLPYIMAVVKETIRWRPVTPSGVYGIARFISEYVADDFRSLQPAPLHGRRRL